MQIKVTVVYGATTAEDEPSVDRYLGWYVDTEDAVEYYRGRHPNADYITGEVA